MYIAGLHVQNFRSYADTGDIDLRPGFNLFVGQNNVGKTALLETLVPGQFSPQPHRTSPAARSQLANPVSTLEIAICISGDDLRRTLLAQGASFWVRIPLRWRGRQNALDFIRTLLARPELTFFVQHSVGPGGALIEAKLPSFHTEEDYGPDPYHSAQFVPRPDRMDFTFNNEQDGGGDNLFSAAFVFYQQAVYRFKAERMNIAKCAIAGLSVLAPNAANLANTLLQLQTTNPRRFDRLNAHMSEIFPNVRLVSSVPINERECEIRIWNFDPGTERDDLTVSLEQSGTGLGQVLAMLYVALTYEAGRTVIIDEPNSFLHPGAARKLIAILKQYPQQYLISTHSPEIIQASEPQTLNLITWENEESRVHKLNASELSDAQRALREVGARLSDVFGYDRVIWVEGVTEAECVPRILRHFERSLLVGTSVAPVVNTGDFEGRRPSAKLIWEIYSQLTSAKALIPPAIAFVFDPEGRSETDQQDLVRRSRGRVRFLPRRCIENYLVHPDALAAVLNTLPSFAGAPIAPAAVEAWLAKHGDGAKYEAAEEWSGQLTAEPWIVKVRAADLLHDLFAELSGAKEEYRKTTHSVALTEWLLKNDAGRLDDLFAFLKAVVERATPPAD